MTNSAQKEAVFSNSQLGVDEIPTLKTLTLLPISKKYRALNIFSIGLIALVLGGIATAIRLQGFWTLPENLTLAYPYVVAGIVALGSVWALYHFFADVRIFYAIREQDISKQSGLIFRKLSCQPILRVQHVEVNRGPLDRWAGLASLQVFSAGGEMHTFEIPGLSIERAEQLREFILAHKDIGAR
ncbi:PH domain-containing protein [Alteromonas sp. ALT199]|uniref:PH domain-containing protein n=1 Tax=unclassified Alteromonas TaxID=2614992 RepID=UPI0004490452|nr:PH domain-containing protein [Alteromonas sp. ALT199]MBT3133551.1 PH domain-containing protein [Alteromonas sp. ALT199]